MVIAIDGPVGSGKGTLATELAKQLGYIYLYTGGMYRALALACLDRKIDLHDENAVLRVLNECNLNLKVSPQGTDIFLGDENVNDKIFMPEVSNETPIVAAHPKVREEMVRRQQEIIKNNNAIVEGRDIANVVAPNAEVKIYLDASVGTRAKRRYDQFVLRDIQKTFDEVLEDTKKRDEHDSSREVSPMGETAGAIVIDTTHDTVQDTIGKVVKILQEKKVL